jgi:hypothetical protein
MKTCKDCDNLWNFKNGDKIITKCVILMQRGINRIVEPAEPKCNKFTTKKLDTTLEITK